MIEPEFQDQAIALKAAGFGTSCFSIEENRITGAIPDGVTIVYRGWMMDEIEYAHFYGWLEAHGLKPLTHPGEYVLTHHIPNWYPYVAGITPETFCFPTQGEMASKIVQYCNENGWTKYQLKDFVKSLKTGVGSVVTQPDEVQTILDEMVKYRGTLEGGICVRRWEDFMPNSEKRYFVLNKRFYGQDELFDTRAMERLIRVARDIPSPFYSVDIAETTTGRFMVVEIGDGQVSDIVGWTPGRFAQIWQNVL